MPGTPVNAVSISARALMNLHSLNNEGTEGNQTQTRMVDVLTRDADGNITPASVNAISGDMFKHMLATHLHRVTTGREMALCTACQQFNANRISADPSFREWITGDDNPTPVQVLNRMLTTCAVDDLLGNLITEAKNSTPRKSTAEFGWIVALPEHITTDDYFHVKYVPDNREKPTDKDAREGNLGQAIFHRPASSGQYAMVCHLETGRIGYNDISQQYAVGEAERQARYEALLESLLYAFVEPTGAMRNTQLPHIIEVKGAVSVSYGIPPAPSLSPLNNGFEEELYGIRDQLNNLYGEEIVQVLPFENLSGLADIVRWLVQETSPYTLTTAAAPTA